MLRARAAPPMRVAFSLVRVVDRCPGLARFGTRLRNDRVSHALFVPALHGPLDLVSAVLVGCRCAARVLPSVSGLPVTPSDRHIGTMLDENLTSEERSERV